MSLHRNRRHHPSKILKRSLSVIGALILFVTFIVKDGLRDRAKDLASAIDSAQDFYVLKEGIDLANAELRAIESRVGVLQNRLFTKDSALSGSPLVSIDNDMEWAENAMELEDNMLRSTSALLKMIGNKPQHEEKLKSERDAVNANQQRFNEIRRLESEYSGVSKTKIRNDSTANLKRINEDLGSLKWGIGTVSESIEQTHNDVTMP